MLLGCMYCTCLGCQFLGSCLRSTVNSRIYSTSRIYFSDLYEMKSSRISYFLGLKISRMLTNKTFLGCQISRIEISRMCIFSDVYLQYFSDVLLGSNIKQIFSDLYENIDFSDLNFSDNLDTSKK